MRAPLSIMLSFLRLVLSLSVLVTVLAACAVSGQLSTPPTDTAMLGGVQAEPSGGAELPFKARGNKPDWSLLTDTEWVVEDIAGRGIIDGSHITLNFGVDGQLSGYASCNSYHAYYDLTGKGLQVDTIATTRKACVPALNYQENRFLKVLRDTRSFNIDKTGKLIMVSGSGDTLAAYPAK